MGTKKYAPLLPSVGLDEILAFRYDDPQTYTKSHIVNAVLEVMQTMQPFTGEKVAKALGVEFKKLSGALEIITGMSFATLRYHWIAVELPRLIRLHPDWSSDQLARALGLYNRTSLYRLLNSPGFKGFHRVNLRPKDWLQANNPKKDSDGRAKALMALREKCLAPSADENGNNPSTL